MLQEAVLVPPLIKGYSEGSAVTNVLPARTEASMGVKLLAGRFMLTIPSNRAWQGGAELQVFPRARQYKC